MKKTWLAIGAAAIIALSGCSSSGHDEKSDGQSHEMNHEGMNHSSSGEVPKNLQASQNPTFKIGSEAIMKADHMKGMDGAKATIVGAYDTTAYTVSYTPTTGGEKVENHKWVIQEEVKGAGKKELKPGKEVTLEADHMKGMKGAEATVDSAEKTTVYMVDYNPTTGGKKVRNHKWVTESELSKP
ncbi:YdhK family protein [Priestia koreensis]|uniref:DUF1541 domain-containing protein n=1 Tax=Priestia koreensis TaxID=284581 RepID=A0A0M0LIF5_9BACI|nr:YdhK family protein [Priestia koreensis]KOO50766.1 hypothetical protein AMD01_03240 [Priestia koreensis]